MRKCVTSSGTHESSHSGLVESSSQKDRPRLFNGSIGRPQTVIVLARFIKIGHTHTFIYHHHNIFFCCLFMKPTAGLRNVERENVNVVAGSAKG